MKQSEIDNIKQFYQERLITIWGTSVDHLQYEEMIAIKKLLSYNTWSARKDFKSFVKPTADILDWILKGLKKTKNKKPIRYKLDVIIEKDLFKNIKG